jgi:hypothetical protein
LRSLDILSTPCRRNVDAPFLGRIRYFPGTPRPQATLLLVTPCPTRGFQHAWRFVNGGAHSADYWNQSLYTSVSQGNEFPTRAYGSGSSLTADSDDHGIDNFGEWTFGTDATRADEEVAATVLMLAQPETSTFRFAHRRLAGHAAARLAYEYLASNNLASWEPVIVTGESTTPLPASPGHELVTLSPPASDLISKERLFLKMWRSPEPVLPLLSALSVPPFS